MSAKVNVKKIILAVLIILAGFALYSFFLKSDEAEKDLLANTLGTSGSVGREFIVLLNELRSLEIDSSIFDLPIFKNLSDFGVDIPAEPVGNPNPFSPAP